jgi:PEP-CTERM motif
MYIFAFLTGGIVNSLKRICLVLPLVLLVLAPARAGSKNIDTVYFNGQFAFGDHGVGIPPYGGTLNGKAEEFYCVDFTHDITGGKTWYVTALNLNSPKSAFGSTRLDNKTEYLEMAWLITQMESVTGNTTKADTTKAEYQWAIWSFTGAVSPYAMSSTFVGEALTAVDDGLFSGKGWEILTPIGTYGQEFLIDPPQVASTPEPSSMLLFGTGLIGLSFAIRKKWPAKRI